MASENDRLAQIFIWKQAGTSDLEYARQILSVVNPGALRVLANREPAGSLLYGLWILARGPVEARAYRYTQFA